MPGRRDAVQQRILAMAVAVTVAFVVIIGQLWYLQVLEGGRFLDASDRNRIRIRPIAAPRGVLFDRNGAPLVDNRPAFTLSLIPRELPRDRKSTRLNSSHRCISYAVFCLKKPNCPRKSVNAVQHRRSMIPPP